MQVETAPGDLPPGPPWRVGAMLSTTRNSIARPLRRGPFHPRGGGSPRAFGTAEARELHVHVLLPFLIVLTLTLLIAMQARAAEVQMFLPGGGVFTKKVESYKERRMQKVVPQTADFSCGAAAVATLLRYQFGQKITEKDAILGMFEHGDKEGIRQRGFSMLDMKRFALAKGLQVQGYRITDAAKLKELNIPVITLINTAQYKHFVVLRKVDDQFAYLSDPSWGNRKMVLEDFTNSWDKVILVLTGPCQGTPEGLYCEAEDSRLPKDWVIRNDNILGQRFAMDPTNAIYTVTRISLGSIADLVPATTP